MRGDATGTRLTVYTRHGCHLCSDMLEELQRLRRELDFELQVLDIDADPALRSRYDTRVPVLADGAEELCYYVLEEDRLRQHLAQGR